MKLTPLGKLVIIVLIFGGIFAGLYFTGVFDRFGGGGDGMGSAFSSGGDDPLTVTTVTWSGFGGGIYFNEGHEPNTESRFFKDYGFKVDFKLIDDIAASREAWKNGEVDVVWSTADILPTEIESLMPYNPRIIFVSDKSRGGDVIVGRRGISNLNDLRGKSVAVTPMSPSHTFLILSLEAAGLTTSDIEVVETETAISSADLFKQGRVDAAVVWSPDDQDCLAKQPGSQILTSTKQATEAIPNIFIVKEDFLEANREKVRQFVEGWLRGNAEVQHQSQSKNKTARLLADYFRIEDESFTQHGTTVARYVTYGDNLNFFGLNNGYNGPTGESIYNRMATTYHKLGYAPQSVPSWRKITETSILKNINLAGDMHEAEEAANFSEPSRELADRSAISSKAVTISFPTGSSALSENAKYIIDREFVDVAQNFPTLRVRIEGHTDDTGSRQTNMRLSESRASAVKSYLVREHGFKPNRFIVIGKGPDEPTASNATEEGRAKNRRTEFEMIEK